MREEKCLDQQHHNWKRKVRWLARTKAVLIVPLVLAAVCPGQAQTAEALSPLRFTLKQAVAASLQKSRELSLARLQYETSREQAGLRRAEFLPNLYVGSGVAYTSGFPLLAGGGAPALFSLSYNQELFDLPSRGQVHAEEQKAEQQRLSIDAVRD